MEKCCYSGLELVSFETDVRSALLHVFHSLMSEKMWELIICDQAGSILFVIETVPE